MKKLTLILLLILIPMAIIGSITLLVVNLNSTYTTISGVVLIPLLILFTSTIYIFNQSNTREIVNKEALLTKASWGTTIPSSWVKSFKTGYKYQYYWNFTFVIITWYFLIAMLLPQILLLAGLNPNETLKNTWLLKDIVQPYYSDWESFTTPGHTVIIAIYASYGSLFLMWITRSITTRRTRAMIAKSTTGTPMEIKTWTWKSFVGLIVLLLLPLFIFWLISYLWKKLRKKKA